MKNKIAKQCYFAIMHFLKKKRQRRVHRVFGFPPGCHFDATANGYPLVFLWYCSNPQDRITHYKHQLISLLI